MPARFRLALPLALLIAGTAARAADVTVVQKDKSFSQAEITIRAGDRVMFRNDDTVVHNVYSASQGASFEIKTQLPGQTAEQRFQKPGEVDVRCAIHPQMKLRVKVEP
jgi:plastocyanin